MPESAIQEDQEPPVVIAVDNYKTTEIEGKPAEVGVARILRVKLGIRDRVLQQVEILDVIDPERKWQGTLDTAKFVIEKGNGLRNGDAIRLEVEEDEEAAPVKKD